MLILCAAFKPQSPNRYRLAVRGVRLGVTGTVGNALTVPGDIPMNLQEIIANGQQAYEATLPEYMKRQEADDSPTHRINLTLTDERMRELCLSCPLADCLDITSTLCPIRIEQRREWRRQNHR